MFTLDQSVQNALTAPVRKLTASVSLIDGGTLSRTFSHNGELIKLSVERVGDETKFIGYGIVQKANFHLRDKDSEIEINTQVRTQFNLGIDLPDGTNYTLSPFPYFYVNSRTRDENTGEYSITCYDALYKANQYTANNVNITAPYTIGEYITAAASAMGLDFSPSDVFHANSGINFDLEYLTGANLEGTEILREVLDDIAEATQTIYFVKNYNGTDRLIFKRLDRDGDPVLVINKSDYFSLDSRDSRRLSTLAHITELGENISASTLATGTTQYLRDNDFLNTRNDVGAILQEGIDAIGGLTLNQFVCEWRGNFGLEIGDKIGLITKDDVEKCSYLVDDTIEYDGSLKQHTAWSYANSDAETETTPSTLGEALKQTYAKVDKADKQISLVATEISGLDEKIAAITIEVDEISTSVKNLDVDSINGALEQIGELNVRADSIEATVQTVQTNTNNSLGAMEESIDMLAERVAATVTAEDVSLIFEQEHKKGIDTVVTTTGFVFDSEGLKISKSGTEMNTQITEDGMTVYRDNTALLVADHVGVKATNLEATTYLLIGKYSRFEDYEPERTGCFWMGRGSI